VNPRLYWTYSRRWVLPCSYPGPDPRLTSGPDKKRSIFVTTFSGFGSAGSMFSVERSSVVAGHLGAPPPTPLSWPRGHVRLGRRSPPYGVGRRSVAPLVMGLSPSRKTHRLRKYAADGKKSLRSPPIAPPAHC